jgi:hypothetical protein
MPFALGNVISGARARLSIGGKKVAYCTNVTFGEEIQYEPIEPLDQLEVAEHVPTAYRVSFSAQHVRIAKNAIKNRDGVAIMPTLAKILTDNPDLSAVIEDSVTGVTLAQVHRVHCSRYSVNIGARGIVLTDCEFVAIKIQDESEI